MTEPAMALISIVLAASSSQLSGPHSLPTMSCEHGTPSWRMGPCILALCEYAAIVVQVEPSSWKRIGARSKVEPVYRERLTSMLSKAGILVDTDPRPVEWHYCIEGAQLWLTLTARDPDPPTPGVVAWSTQLEVREYGSLERAAQDRSFVVTWLGADVGATTESNLEAALNASVDRLATQLYWMHVGYLSGQRPHGACGPPKE